MTNLWDTSLKKVAAVYHPDKHRLTISLESNMSDSNFFFYSVKYSIEVFKRYHDIWPIKPTL